MWVLFWVWLLVVASHPQMEEGPRDLCMISFIKMLIPILRSPPLWPNCLLNNIHGNTITKKIRISKWIFEQHKHSDHILLLFCKMFVSVFCLFFCWAVYPFLIDFRSSLTILTISDWIFFHSTGWFFTLLMYFDKLVLSFNIVRFIILWLIMF